MIVAKRRITATRAIFAPRRVLILLYHCFIRGSREHVDDQLPEEEAHDRLPCLVIEPKRSVASPELRQPGVKPK